MKYIRTAALGAALSIGAIGASALPAAAQELDAAQVMTVVDAGVTISLNGVEESTVTGEVRLEGTAEQTQVVLRVVGAEAGATLQGLLVPGACDAAGEPIVEVRDIVVDAEGNAEATVTVPVGFDALVGQPLAIQLRSAGEAAETLACGAHTPAEHGDHEAPAPAPAPEPTPTEPPAGEQGEAEPEEGR